jgi:hypothetical protein
MNGSASVTHTSRPAEDVFADITRTPLRPPGLSEARRTDQGLLQAAARLVCAEMFRGRRCTSPGQALESMFA